MYKDNIILEKLDYFRKMLYNIKRDILGLYDDESNETTNIDNVLKKLKREIQLFRRKK